MPFTSSQKSLSRALEFKVAGVTIDALGRQWDPSKHPRDSRGRFVETGGIARVGLGGLGKVVRSMIGGKVEVQMRDGSRKIVPSQQLTMVRRPDGSKPTASVRKVVEQDAERENDDARGDGKYDKDENPALDVPDADPEDEDDDNPYDGDDDDPEIPEVPETYTPSRQDPRTGDVVAVTAVTKDGKTHTLFGKIDHIDQADNAKPDQITLAGGKKVRLRELMAMGKTDGNDADYTVIPFEDLNDPAALIADALDDNNKAAVLDNETATDLVEGHAKATAPKPKAKAAAADQARPVNKDDIVMGTKPGTVTVGGRIVGRIERDPEDPKFWKVTDRFGRSKRVGQKWDTGRTELARMLNNPPQAKDKAPAPAKAPTPAAAPVAPQITPEAPEADLLTPETPAAPADQSDQGREQQPTQAAPVPPVPVEAVVDRVTTETASKQSRALTKIESDRGAGFKSKSGNLIAVKGTRGYAIYRRINSAEERSATGHLAIADGDTYDYVGDSATLEEFRLAWVGTKEDHPPTKPNLTPEAAQQSARLPEADEQLALDMPEPATTRLPEGAAPQKPKKSLRESLGGNKPAARLPEGAAPQKPKATPAAKAPEAPTATTRLPEGAAPQQPKTEAAPAAEKRPSAPPAGDYAGTTTEGDTDERPVPQPDSPVLGDVPAERSGQDGTGRPGAVLPQPGSGRGGSGGGSDRGEPRSVGAPDGRPGDEGASRGDSPVEGPRGSARGDGVPAQGEGDSVADAADLPAVVNAAQRGVDGQEFRPTSQADLAGGEGKTQKERAQENLAALRTLRTIQSEGRQATADEQAVMAKWGGMGAIRPLFTKAGKDADWGKMRDEFRALVPDDAEWEGLKDNAANAHYTDYAIVDAMWGALEGLGFERGNVLEPGSGLGNFIFRAPGGAKVHGVEVEPITAAIAQLLSPHATIRNEDFGRTRANKGSFDAAIGNVPFGNYRIYDSEFNPKLKKRIHDHFIEKTLASVKPGGVMAMVTSAGTLDKGDRSVREAIYAHSDLLGSVRLPNGSHKDAAGTDVATDVLIFRVRKPGEKPGDDSWLGASPVFKDNGDPVVGSRSDEAGNKIPQTMNDYYLRHPEHVLGDIVDGGFNHIEVRGDFDADALAATLENIVQEARESGHDYTPADASGDELFREPAARLEATVVEVVRPADGIGENLLPEPSQETLARRGNRLQGSLTHVGTWARKRPKTVDASGTIAGKVKVTEEHQFTIVDAEGNEVDHVPSQGERDELARLLRMRDLREDLIFLEKSEEADLPQMDELRAELAREYDEYAAVYGPISRVKVGWRKMTAKQVATYQAALDKGEDPDPDIRPTADGFEKVSRTYPGMGGMRIDPSFWSLLDLEGDYDEGSPDDPRDWGTATRGPILSKRQMRPYEPPTTADNPDDALAIVEEKLGRIDLDEVARVLGLDGGARDALAVLGDRVLKDHRTGEWVKYGTYIGKINLRETLRDLQEAVAEDPSLQRNIDMIAAAMPADKKLKDIQTRLGSNWMPPETFLDFMRETVGGHAANRITLDLSKDDEGRNVWSIKGQQVGPPSLIGGNYAPDDRTAEQRDKDHPQFTPVMARWGTSRKTFQELVEHALNSSVPIVQDTHTGPDGKPYKVLNMAETEAAKDMLKRIETQFAVWLRSEPVRATKIERLYNDRFRSRVPVNYINSPDRAMPGMNAAVKLDQHQIDGVTRGVEEDSMGAAWEVGVGKTYLAGALYAERVRLGKSRKVYHTTPNHLVEQTAREFKHLYPDMKILVVDGENMKSGPTGDTERIRRRTMSQMRDGDWDVVIVSESADARILPSLEALLADKEDQLAKLRAKREKAEEKDNQNLVNQTTNQIKDLEASIEQDRDTLDAGDQMDFMSLGFDYVGVDESHRYKNDLVLGGPPNFNSAAQASKRARNLRAKIDSVRAANAEQGRGDGVLLLSGTPVTNNTREFFVNLRMLRPDLLEEAGVLDFDDFYSTFLESAEDIEGTVSGGAQIKVRDGFRLVNAGELVRMWQQAWDVVKAADVGIERPELRGGAMEQVTIPMTEAQLDYYKHLQRRYDNRPRKWKLDKGDDNALAIGNDGLMAAIDMRLLPDHELAAIGLSREDLTDNDGKVGPLADKVIASWKATKDKVYQTKRGNDRNGNPYPDHENTGALQLIFSDVGVPGGNSKSGFNLYEAIKNRLVAEGMDPSEVAFIHDAADKATLKKLTDKARVGQIKVLIGSSGKMATGLNVQDRLTDVWHIDTQKTPDVIEQRNGRAIRRGNQNAEVNIGYVTTEGTSEAWAWSVAANKDNFLREFDEADMDSTIVGAPEDNAAAPLMQLKATASQNPHMIEQFRAKKDTQELERAYAIHQGQIEAASATILRAETAIASLNGTIASFEKALETWDPITTGDKSNFLLKTPTGSYGKLEDAANAFQNVVRAAMVKDNWLDTTPWETFGTLGGQSLSIRRSTNTRGDKRIEVGVKDPLSYREQMLPGSVIAIDPTSKIDSTTAVRLRNMVNKLADLKQGVVNERTDQENVLAQSHETLSDTSFAREAELDAARVRLDALDKLARFDIDPAAAVGSDLDKQRERRALLEAAYQEAKDGYKDLHDSFLEANGGAKAVAKLGAVKRSRRTSQQEAADRMNERIRESGVPLGTVPRKVRTQADEDAAKQRAGEVTVRKAKSRTATARPGLAPVADGEPATADEDMVTLDAAQVEADLALGDAPTPEVDSVETPEAPEVDGNDGDDEPPAPPAPPAADEPDPEPDPEPTQTVAPADLPKLDDELPAYGQKITLLDGRVLTFDQDSFAGMTARDENGALVTLDPEAVVGWTPYAEPAPVADEADTALDLDVTAAPTPERNPDFGKRVGEVRAVPEAGGAATIMESVGTRVPGETIDRVLWRVKRSDGAWNVYPPNEQAPAAHSAGSKAEAMKWALDRANGIPDPAEAEFEEDVVTVSPADLPTLDAPSPTKPAAPSKQEGLDFTDVESTPDAPTIGDAIAEQEAEDAAAAETPEYEAGVWTKVDGRHQFYDAETRTLVQVYRKPGYSGWYTEVSRDGEHVVGSTTDSLADSKADASDYFTMATAAERFAVRNARSEEIADAMAADDEVLEQVRESAKESAIAEGATEEEAEVAADVAEADAATESADLTAERPLAPVLAEPAEPKTPTQLEDEKFPLTPQQQSIADAVVADRDDVVVEAGAGAGKTSTLEAIAKRFKVLHPDEQIAYVAFNKTVQTEAEGRMPGNVEPRTGHSIAWAWAGRDITSKRDNRAALRRADEIARHLGINEPLKTEDGSLTPAEQAQAAIALVDAWSNSADDKITDAHLPERLSGLDAAGKKRLVSLAEKAWADLASKDGQIKVSFDHIRKMWALSKPDLSKPGSGLRKPATVLFLDEAQDTPPVLAKVIEDQTMQKVIVGDTNQAIYGFTGAVDYLKKAAAKVRLPLTKSWRFGPQVADMGNRFLQVLGAKERVEGGGPDSTIVDNMEAPDAILVRSNGGMIGEILREQEAGRTVGVPKGTKADLISLAESARYLKGEGGAPDRMHEDLAPYRTWAEVTEAAEEGDQKLAMLGRIIDQYGVDGLEQIVRDVVELEDGLNGVRFEQHTTGLVATGKGTFDNRETLKAAGFRWMEVPGAGVYTAGKNKGQPIKGWTATGTPEQQQATLDRAKEAASGVKPDVVVSTAHKAKGLEWDRVRIGSDFRGPEESPLTGELIMPADEELKLAYVAVTRAARELDMGSLGWVLAHSNANGKDDTKAPAAAAAPAVAETTPEVEPYPYDVNPEGISEDDVAQFTNGHCGELAMAIHDATGWPIAVVADQQPIEEGGLPGWYHAGVMTPEGLFLDVTGPKSVDDVLDHWEDFGDPEEGDEVVLMEVDAEKFRPQAIGGMDTPNENTDRVRDTILAQFGPKPGDALVADEPEPVAEVGEQIVLTPEQLDAVTEDPDEAPEVAEVAEVAPDAAPQAPERPRKRYGMDLDKMDDEALEASSNEWQERFNDEGQTRAGFNAARLDFLLDERDRRDGLDPEEDTPELEAADDAIADDSNAVVAGDDRETRQRKRRKDRRKRYDPTPTPGGDGGGMGGPGAGPLAAPVPIGQLPLDGDPDPAGSAAAADAEDDRGIGALLIGLSQDFGGMDDFDVAAVRDRYRVMADRADVAGQSESAAKYDAEADAAQAELDRRAAATQATETGPNGGLLTTAGALRVGESVYIDGDLYDVDTADEAFGGRRRIVLTPSFGPAGVPPIGRIERWSVDRPVELEAETAGDVAVGETEGTPEVPAVSGDFNGGNPGNLPELGRVPVTPLLAKALQDLLDRSSVTGFDYGYTLDPSGKFISVHDKAMARQALEQVQSEAFTHTDNPQAKQNFEKAAAARLAQLDLLPDTTPEAAPDADVVPEAADGDVDAFGIRRTTDTTGADLAQRAENVERVRGARLKPAKTTRGLMGGVSGAAADENRQLVEALRQAVESDSPRYVFGGRNGYMVEDRPNSTSDYFEVMPDGSVTQVPFAATQADADERPRLLLPDAGVRNMLANHLAPADAPEAEAPEADEPLTEVADGDVEISDAEWADLTGTTPAVVADEDDERPEPLVNGHLPNPQGLILPADLDGDYSPEQIEFLSQYAPGDVIANIGDEWLPGSFEGVRGGKYVFRPATSTNEADVLEVDPADLHEIRGVRVAEGLAEAVDPTWLRPGTRVAFTFNKQQRVGILEGVDADGRAQVRGIDGTLHTTTKGGLVRPVMGGYRPGAEPTEAAFAPKVGVWSQDGDTWQAAVPTEWVAAVAPAGDGYRWEVQGAPGTGFATKFGETGTREQAQEAVADALFLAATEGPWIRTLPGGDENDRDNRTRELADTLAELGGGDETTVGDTPADETADAPEVNGAKAGWVPTGELQPGDIAQVDGDNGNGSATTRTGHVLGTPESVEVHSPTGGKPAKGTRTTVGDDRNGLGDRETVLSPEASVSARVERDDEHGDADNPANAYESQVLSGNVGDTLPTDRNGLGLFPGSVVVDHRDREGVVNEAWDLDVAVRWAGDDKDVRVRPGTLTVHPDKQARPEGWTVGGKQVKADQIVELDGGDRGKVLSVAGDDVTLETLEGEQRTVSAGDLKVVGTVRDTPAADTPVAAEPAFEAPQAPEGLDVRPTRPVKPAPLPEDAATVAPNFNDDDRQVLTELGIHTDAVTPMTVQDAAARILNRMPISTEQATDLSAWLGALLGSKNVPAGRARKVKRLRNRLDAANTRAGGGQPEPRWAVDEVQAVTAADVVRGDVIAVPNPATGEADTGIVRGVWGTQNGQVIVATIEHADGTWSNHNLNPDGAVFLLPDTEALDKDAPVSTPANVIEEDRPFTEPRVSERLQDAAEAVTDAVLGEDEAPADLATLAEQVNERLDTGADARGQRNAAARLETSLEGAGITPESAEAAHEAAEDAADAVAEQVADMIRETVADAEPLPGESDADAAARVRDSLREVANEVPYDNLAAAVLDRVAEGAVTVAPTRKEQGHATRELQDALRADLFNLADQLAAMGDVEGANALSDAAARLAGRPDEAQVQRAIAAASMGRGPSRVRSLAPRIRGIFTRQRARFLETVTSTRAGRSLKAAVAAARNEWTGNSEVADLIDAAAAHLANGGDAETTTDATVEPTSFAERMAYWAEQLPEEPGMFGRREATVRGFRGLTLDRLRRGGRIEPDALTGSVLDRAADGGPGAYALAHHDAVSGMGRAIRDEVDARIRAELPEFGPNPAETVAESWDHVARIEAEMRANMDDPELAKMRRKARAKATMDSVIYAQVRAESVAGVLAQARPMGPTGAATINVQGRKGAAPEVDALRWAEQFFPTDWIATAGTVEAKAGRMGSYGDGEVTVAPLKMGLTEGAGMYGASALHGLAHHFETTVPGLADAAWVHHWKQTSAGEVGQRTRRGANALSWFADLFPGVGFERGDGAARGARWDGSELDAGHYEWVPTAFESIFAGTDAGSSDDMDEFMLGLLAWLAKNR